MLVTRIDTQHRPDQAHAFFFFTPHVKHETCEPAPDLEHLSSVIYDCETFFVESPQLWTRLWHLPSLEIDWTSLPYLLMSLSFLYLNLNYSDIKLKYI